ncbi:MAG: hypothetical protein KIS92_25275, partial [Planctomycetota bacterium]|nr:hypothetical protein [Planctomycetota bacterium]
MTHPVELPQAFGRVVAEAIPGILKHQTADGSIVYSPLAPIVYPQQAIFPLAFVWAGLDPDQRWRKHGEVRACIENLGGFLLSRFNEKGEFSWDSHGYQITGVDQRLTYAWIEGLRILREAGADHDFAAWGKKIAAACETL